MRQLLGIGFHRCCEPRRQDGIDLADPRSLLVVTQVEIGQGLVGTGIWLPESAHGVVVLADELLSGARTWWDALMEKGRHSVQKLAALGCRLLVVGDFPTGGGRRGTAEGGLHTGAVHRRQVVP